MSDRFNIEIMGPDRFGKYTTIRANLRDSHDTRYNIDFALPNYVGDYTTESVYKFLKKEAGLCDRQRKGYWYSMGICDGMTEIRINKEDKTIERVDWLFDYENKKVFGDGK